MFETRFSDTKSKQSSQLMICTSKECIRSAANLKYSMNLSANPCNDFYDFCCGKWSQEHPNHGWYSSFSTFTTITEKIVIKAMKVLSEDLKTDEPVAVGQAKLLFQSCLSTGICWLSQIWFISLNHNYACRVRWCARATTSLPLSVIYRPSDNTNLLRSKW